MTILFDRSSGLCGGPLDTSRARAYWDAASPSYALDATRGLVRLTSRLQHDAAIRLAALSPGARVLDAGAGSGRLARRLIDAGCRVTACDASVAMIEKLRHVVAATVLCKLEELDLPPGFDAVMAIGVLNFVSTPEDTFRRLCNAVAPGGVLVLQVTEWSFFGALYALTYRLHGFRPFLFTRHWLCDHARAWGFTLVGSEHPLPHDLTMAFRRAHG